MKIRYYPKGVEKSVNPLNLLLYRQISEMGVPCAAFENGEDYSSETIIHIHWPDELIRSRWVSLKRREKKLASFGVKRNVQSFFQRFRRLRKFIAEIRSAKLAGSKVVWTVHNIKPHEGEDLMLARFFWSRFLNLVDAIICMSETSQEMVNERYKRLRNVPCHVIPRGNFKYLLNIPTNREKFRRDRGVADGQIMYLCFGRLRGYKNLPALVECFGNARLDDAQLFISGSEIKGSPVGVEIESTVADYHNIHLDRRNLTEVELAEYVDACDIVVLPYKQIMNSAAAILALSCSKPVLTPRMGTLAEFADEFGEDWVHGYEGPLRPGIIEESARAFRSRRKDLSPPDMRRFEWPAVARGHIDAFKMVLQADGDAG